MLPAPFRRTRAFISYSHQDQSYLAELQQHLALFQCRGWVDTWADTQIQPGQDWFAQIQHALATAKVTIFLVSPAFLASEFIARYELPPLLEAAQREGVTLWVTTSADFGRCST
jgi:internalin A